MLKNITAKLTITAVLFTYLFAPFISQAGVFNPNHIISDYEFTDYKSMTFDDIYNFLKKKNSYLARFVDPQSRMLAAQIIYDNSQLYRINPKVLLVTLQKEQSLITDPNPDQDQLDWATGYGICDSCSKKDPKLQKYKGFTNQVDYAASAFRLFYNNPYKYGFSVGKTYTIDGQRVTVANRATHALYVYTPHIQGNKNFYKIWQDWFTQNYPDGSILQNISTGGIYLIQNGTKRPFTSKAAFLSRYSFDKVIKVSPETLDSYPDGVPIKYAQYSLVRSPRGTVYLIVDDMKRGIASREVFRKIGFNPEEIIDLPQEEIDSIPEGPPITIKSIYPMGALLQDKTTGGVWYVKDGVKHPIWSKELMNTNFPNYRIIPTDPEELDQYAKGSPVKFKDGEIVKSRTKPTVYFISNGYKRPIASVKDFEKLGFKWENIITTDDKSLSLHPTGEVLRAEN